MRILCRRIIKYVSRDIEAHRERKKERKDQRIRTISIGLSWSRHGFFAFRFARRRGKIPEERFARNRKLFSVNVQTRLRSRFIIPSTDHIHTGTQVNTATRNTMSINYISLKFRIKFERGLTEHKEREKERGKERKKERRFRAMSKYSWSNVVELKKALIFSSWLLKNSLFAGDDTFLQFFFLLGAYAFSLLSLFFYVRRQNSPCLFSRFSPFRSTFNLFSFSFFFFN